MLIAYDPVYESSKWNEPDSQPRLFVGRAGGYLLSLTTSDFDVRYKDGKAEVTLARHMTPEQARAFALTLLDSANAAIKQENDWRLSSERLASAPVDDECPACDGSGKLG